MEGLILSAGGGGAGAVLAGTVMSKRAPSLPPFKALSKRADSKFEAITT